MIPIYKKNNLSKKQFNPAYCFLKTLIITLLLQIYVKINKKSSLLDQIFMPDQRPFLQRFLRELIMKFLIDSIQ